MSVDDAPDCPLVPLGDRHVSSMLRIFNDCVADGFAADPEKPLPEEEMADIIRQTSGHATVAADTLKPRDHEDPRSLLFPKPREPRVAR